MCKKLLLTAIIVGSSLVGCTDIKPLTHRVDAIQCEQTLIHEEIDCLRSTSQPVPGLNVISDAQVKSLSQSIDGASKNLGNIDSFLRSTTQPTLEGRLAKAGAVLSWLLSNGKTALDIVKSLRDLGWISENEAGELTNLVNKLLPSFPKDPVVNVKVDLSVIEQRLKDLSLTPPTITLPAGFTEAVTKNATQLEKEGKAFAKMAESLHTLTKKSAFDKYFPPISSSLIALVGWLVVVYIAITGWGRAKEQSDQAWERARVQSDKQLWLSAFLDFTKRYDEIFEKLPLDIKNRNMNYVVDSTKPEINALDSFFFLYWIEFQAKKDKAVEMPDEMWGHWMASLKEYFKLPAVRACWKIYRNRHGANDFTSEIQEQVGWRGYEPTDNWP